MYGHVCLSALKVNSPTVFVNGNSLPYFVVGIPSSLLNCGFLVSGCGLVCVGFVSVEETESLLCVTCIFM